MNGIYAIVTGYSGAGKSTLVQHLLAEFPGAIRVISSTTRPPRTGEQNGIDYHFMDIGEFEQRRKNGEFVEYELDVSGNAYGTLRADIEHAVAKHQMAFHVVDIKGARTLLSLFPSALSVFVSTTKDELEKRLIRRGDKPDSIARRLARIAEESVLQEKTPFDLVLENADGKLEESVNTLRMLFIERLRFHDIGN